MRLKLDAEDMVYILFNIINTSGVLFLHSTFHAKSRLLTVRQKFITSSCFKPPPKLACVSCEVGSELPWIAPSAMSSDATTEKPPLEVPYKPLYSQYQPSQNSDLVPTGHEDAIILDIGRLCALFKPSNYSLP